LARPDLGKILTAESCLALQELKKNHNFDIAWIVSDGLSTAAIETHFIPLWGYCKALLEDNHLRSSPLILAPFSRVAIADEIGEILKCRLAIIFIGERPGLSSVDSLGIYLTYHPKLGNQDSNRNCISNIRPPDELSYQLASLKLNYLIHESIRRGLSGVSLKEEARPLLGDDPVPALLETSRENIQTGPVPTRGTCLVE
jgi:ethanolamine ammonia-lyase small subunit